MFFLSTSVYDSIFKMYIQFYLFKSQQLRLMLSADFNPTFLSRSLASCVRQGGKLSLHLRILSIVSFILPVNGARIEESKKISMKEYKILNNRMVHFLNYNTEIRNVYCDVGWLIAKELQWLNGTEKKQCPEELVFHHQPGVIMGEPFDFMLHFVHL